jgi:long-chain acyl-CoA synthetase
VRRLVKVNGVNGSRIHKVLSGRASVSPDKVAVVAGSRRVTYGDVDKGVSRLAGMLPNSGLEKGGRVCICLENSPEYIIANFGVQKAAGITVDINPQYSAHEARTIVRDCEAGIVITDDKFLQTIVEAVKDDGIVHTVIISRTGGPALRKNAAASLPSSVRSHYLADIIQGRNGDESFPEVGGQDIAAIVYTSGSTGVPKGVMLSHENFEVNADSIIQYFNLCADDSVMVLLPFCYSFGKSLLNTHIIAGGTLVLEKRFLYPNVILDKMVEEDVTGFAGVPSTYSILLNRSNIRNYRFPKLRYLAQAGGALPPKHAQEITSLFPDKKFYIMYGQTEATARITYLDPDDVLRKPGSIGKPIPGVSIELIKEDGAIAGAHEEGEITVTGRNVMIGYWNKPAETEKVLKNGRLHTGDLAKRDEEGYLYLIGRRSDMIKSGAHRISPKEIEEIILELGEVHEVCVVGVEDEVLGDALCAFIVLREGCEGDEKKIQRHCQMKLAAFKIPKHVHFMKELPKTVTGKVRRFILKELISSSDSGASDEDGHQTPSAGEATHELKRAFLDADRVKKIDDGEEQT